MFSKVSPDDEESAFLDSDDEDEDDKGDCNWQFWGMCCCGSCCCLLPIIYLAISIIGGMQFVHRPVDWGWAEGLTACDKYWCGPGDGPELTPQNFTRYMRWYGIQPAVGYKTNKQLDAQTCFPSQLIYVMEDYNKDAPYKKVFYNARPDPEGKAKTAKISAWALPTPETREGTVIPRIIVQHGVGSNQNNRFANFAAYNLRIMGFHTLVPSLRNHGWSEHTEHDRTSWGWIYAYDVLGGYDYLKADPDNIFGGPVPGKSVGLLGISMGGFIAITVAGLEHDIGGIMDDSGPFDPRMELQAQISSIPGFIQELIMPGVWWGTKFLTGADIGRYTPSKTVPCTSSDRKTHLAVTTSLNDTFVPVEQIYKTLELFSKYPNCYDITQLDLPAAKCGGMYHAYEMFLNHDDYRGLQCVFFTRAFGLDCSYCALEKCPAWTKYTTTEEKEIAIRSACAAKADLNRFRTPGGDAVVQETFR